MSRPEHTSFPTAGYSAALRAELCERSRAYAEQHGLPHVESYGSQRAVVFSPYRNADGERECCHDGGFHGNFLAASYKAILANDAWKRRLQKVHTSARSQLPAGDRGRWRELDSCTSSDALLMNIFCYPRLWSDGRISGLLGVNADARPRFGVPARVPMLQGKFDRTEIDMQIGADDAPVVDARAEDTLLVEAKLTEFDFRSAPKQVVESYRDFAAVFDRRELRHTRQRYGSYQLIRNVLAAHATGASFAVLCDARRPDLLETWHATMRAIKPVDLRLRCKVLTWQELAAVLPPRLKAFLEEKYGIIASR